MRIFHILITVISCISYTVNPLEMLLVDKNDLIEIVNKKMSCSLCGTNICQRKNEPYDDSNKASFMNYCFNHFRCSCCASIFHASCFVYFRTNIVTTCPNPYCSSMYSLSEMERFFGQLLLSYAYNDEPIEEFKNLYDEFRLRMFKNSNINTKQLNSEPETFAYLAKAYKKQAPETKINNIIEEIFINTLINGRMAHALMDSVLWNILGDYLNREINYPLEQKNYIQKLMGSDMSRQYHITLDANKKPTLRLRDKLYQIRTLVNAMNQIKHKPDLPAIYKTYVVNSRFEVISELRATYFFVILFQKPDALLVIEETGIQLSKILNNDVMLSSEIRDKILIKFKGHDDDGLINASEAVFRKLYTDYALSAHKKNSLIINLDYNETKENIHLIKLLVRLVLGMGNQPDAYSKLQNLFMLKTLSLCCVKKEIHLLPGEICSALKWFNLKNEHFSPETQTKAENLLRWMLEIPIPPEAIVLYEDTLINNYTPYLGRIYAEYISKNTLLAMSNRNIRKRLIDQERADDFENYVFLYKKFILKQ